MGRRLFLHVGTMKSATTYVQAICDANTEALAERGLLWLGAAANFSAVSDLYGTGRPYEYGRRLMPWSSLVERVEAHEGDVLVSNELLSLRGPAKVAKLVRSLPPVEVRVIVTARDLARATVSQWQERARHRATGTWDAFMAALTADDGHNDPEVAWFWRRQDLPRLVSTWSDQIGADNVTLVTVPPSGSPSTVIGDRFFGVFGLDGMDGLTVPPLTHNQSMGVQSLELIRRVHQRLGDDDRERLHLVVKYIVARRVLAERADDEPSLMLTSAQIAWARDEAQQMSAALTGLGVSVVGDLDELIPPPVEPASDRPAPAPSDAELLDAAVDALIGLARATDELARELGGADYGDAVRAVAGRGNGQP